MNSLDRRRDVRTVDTFKHNIKDFTERESYWGSALQIDFIERGMNCSVEEFGVDNTGKLITEKLNNYNVDKVFHFKGKKSLYFEIKTIAEYVTNFFTFKACALKSCCFQNASILVPRSKSYYIIPKKTCLYFLENYPIDIYPKFSSTDPSVRIPMDDIKKMIQEKTIMKKDWEPKAKQYIENNFHILFREKKQ